QVDAQHLRLGKGQPAIDDQDPPARLDQGDVLADLAHPAQRDDAQGFRHLGSWKSVICSASSGLGTSSGSGSGIVSWTDATRSASSAWRAASSAAGSPRMSANSVSRSEAWCSAAAGWYIGKMKRPPDWRSCPC